MATITSESPTMKEATRSRTFAQDVRMAAWLGWREIRTSMRMPAMFIPNLIVPLFFYFVMVASIENLAAGRGLTNYRAFQLPASIIIAVMSGGAGLNMVTDIESGYFDKLLCTPVGRWAILVGGMGADFLRVFVQGLLVTAVALMTGLHFVTGLPGALVMVTVGALWGIAYSAIGFAVAIKTGSAQATQAMWSLFLPFFFLTTTFAPLDALSGWLKAAATYNPLTYVLRSLRSLSTVGWSASEIRIGLLAAGGLGLVTISFAIWAMRLRANK